VDLVSDEFIGSLQRQNDNKIKELEILVGRNAHSPPLVMLYNDPVLPLLQLNPAHSLSGALPQ